MKILFWSIIQKDNHHTTGVICSKISTDEVIWTRFRMRHPRTRHGYEVMDSSFFIFSFNEMLEVNKKATAQKGVNLNQFDVKDMVKYIRCEEERNLKFKTFNYLWQPK